MPKLSIITICYNNKEGLRRTLDSVVEQLTPDIEYIIVDGGSTDGSREVVASVAGKLGWWCSEKDAGIYNAMNKGVAHATGEYLLFLNSGDTLHAPDVLKRVLPKLHTEDIIYGNLMWVNPKTGERIADKQPDTINADKLLTGSLPHPATFIRRQLLVDNPYDENLRIASDWVFFVKEIMWKGRSTRHVDITISDFIEDGISSVNRELNRNERKQMIKQLFTPAIIEVCEKWRATEVNASPEMLAIGRTRKLHKRIRPLLRAILWVNNLFSRH